MGFDRWKHLDGIRGLAAVAVAVYHFGRAFRNDLLFAPSINCLSSMWNGGFAVQLFFVLSAFLFFSKFYRAGIHEAYRGCAKRYVRLTAPVLIASLIAFAIHSSGGFFNLQAAELSKSDWLPHWYRFAPSFLLAIQEPLYGMYLYFNIGYTYNSNIWTIRYELFYIWLVIVAAVACSHLRLTHQVALLVLIAPFSYLTYGFAFVVGVTVALIRMKGIDRDASPFISIPLLVAGLWLGSLAPFPMDFSFKQTIVWPIGAAMVLVACDRWRLARQFLLMKLPQTTGRLSFGIYIMHFLMINSVASWLYLATGSSLVAFLGYAVAVGISATAFEYAANAPSLVVANYLFRAPRSTALSLR